VSTRIAPSAALEAAIEEFLAEGLGDGERLAELWLWAWELLTPVRGDTPFRTYYRVPAEQLAQLAVVAEAAEHWGYDETGRRVLLDVVLGQRERFEDWLEMGRDLVRRGLRAPMPAVTDGAPGLIRAMEELWPDSDRQRCTGAPLAERGRQAAEERHSAPRAGGRRPTGPRSMRPPRRSTARRGCGAWSPTWSDRTRARRPAWPRICGQRRQ
jgi:hypothetical protein